jgi:hypothetical protein
MLRLRNEKKFRVRKNLLLGKQKRLKKEQLGIGCCTEANGPSVSLTWPVYYAQCSLLTVREAQMSRQGAAVRVRLGLARWGMARRSGHGRTGPVAAGPVMARLGG